MERCKVVGGFQCGKLFDAVLRPANSADTATETIYFTHHEPGMRFDSPLATNGFATNVIKADSNLSKSLATRQ